ncbi:MAG: SprT-like domain-containing protein [Bdellovibrionota bacterium]
MTQLLADIFHELNLQHFSGELPLPELEWNSRLSSTAGRFCPGIRRPILAREPKIEVASYLRELSDGQDHVRDTVLHEMIHYFLWHRRLPYGHTPEFHDILKRVGAKRFNTVPKVRPVKYWYECPGCLRRIPARRRMDRYACASCCEKYSAGMFKEKFRLRLVENGGGQECLGENRERDTSPSRPRTEASASASSLPSARPKIENAPLPPQEIVRRLEELKKLLFRSRS